MIWVYNFFVEDCLNGRLVEILIIFEKISSRRMMATFVGVEHSSFYKIID